MIFAHDLIEVDVVKVQVLAFSIILLDVQPPVIIIESRPEGVA